MTTIVNSETKKLLFNKGWRYKLSLDETGHRVEHSLAEQRWNEGDLTYVDITIAEVAMWLYEKHGIFIQLFPAGEDKEWRFYSKIIVNDNGWIKIQHQISKFVNSPTEAYEAAIEYVLTNLI